MRKETKQLIAGYKASMSGILDTPVRVSFGTITPFVATLRDVVPGKVGDVINKPDKRDVEVKPRTPDVMELVFDEGTFYFVVEDIDGIVALLSGITIVMQGGLRIRMEAVV